MAGAPSKYNPEMCEQLISLMSEGLSKTAVSVELGISKETLYQWSDPEGDYYKPEFSDAVKEGLARSQAWWERKLTEAATGQNKDANATLMIFIMKNQFRQDWSDLVVSEQRHSFVVSDTPEQTGDEWLSNHKPK